VAELAPAFLSYGQHRLSRSRAVCPEEGTYLAHRQGNPLLGLLPREHAHFGLWREHRGLHGDGVRERLENDVGSRIFYLPMASKIAGLFAYNDELGGCVGIITRGTHEIVATGL